MAGLFDGMNSARDIASGSYFPYELAQYVCQIGVAKFFDTRKNGKALVVELDVLECSNPKYVGARFDFFEQEKGDYFLINGRAFIVALFGFVPGHPEAKAWADTNSARIWEQAIDPYAQPLAGMKIRVQTTPSKAKQSGKDVTKVHYEPWYASHAEAMAAFGKSKPVGTNGVPTPPPAPPPVLYTAPMPPAPVTQSTWLRSPDGNYMLNPHTMSWEPAVR